MDTIFKAIWVQGLNMSDKQVMAQALTDAGLPSQALMAATQEPLIKQALMDNTQSAVDRGVFGHPAFFVGEEMFFGKDQFDQIEIELDRG